MKDKKIAFILIFILGVTFAFSEELSSFIEIPFGSERTEVCITMMNKGWKITENSGERIIFSGGDDIYYDSLYMYDRVAFFFTDKGIFYQVRFILFDGEMNVKTLENYIQNTIYSSDLELIVDDKDKKTYCSSNGYLFSYQLQKDDAFPALIIEKGNPLILVEKSEDISELEILNPDLCVFLQTGSGKDFYYLVSDVPGTNYNVVYFSKSQNFNTIVYVCLYQDPEGLRIANYIDSNKELLHLSDLLENTQMDSCKVSWCSKLIYYHYIE